MDLNAKIRIVSAFRALLRAGKNYMAQRRAIHDNVVAVDDVVAIMRSLDVATTAVETAVEEALLDRANEVGVSSLVKTWSSRCGAFASQRVMNLKRNCRYLSKC